MYFASRLQAGRMLASQLVPKYKHEPCAVIALSDGGVMVGAQIAVELGCVLSLLLVDEIGLPREPVAVAGISQDGTFSYNHAYAQSEIDEILSEYRSVIEAEKLEKLHIMHAQTGSKALIRPELLKGHHVILVSDGLPNPFSLDLAETYLKRINYKSLVVATPLASVATVDRMHIMADAIYCLSVIEDYITTDHYYDVQDIPRHDLVVKTIERITGGWSS